MASSHSRHPSALVRVPVMTGTL